MYKNKIVAVIIPAYNEEKLIGEVIKRIPDYIDRVFIVDDCSRDNTYQVASRLASMNSGHIQVIRHEQNGGVGKAIVTGYKASLRDNVDIAVIMAGDNQMDPLQLPRLLDPVVDGTADYAVGDRLSKLKHQKGMSTWRRLGNFLLKWLTRIAAWNMHITDPQNGYTAVSREALEKLASIGCPSLDTHYSSLNTQNSQSPSPETHNFQSCSGLDAIYPRYGYCNDMLVKFSGTGARIKQVQMPAVYGTEKSKIRYYIYIPKVSWLLLKGFFWRIKVSLFRSKPDR
jgi:glycosyltransferase involved in cell wall biosynthesis